MLNFFPGEPKLLLFPNVGPSLVLKNYFCNCWHEMIYYHELLSAPKITTFLAMPLSKLQIPSLSNVIP